MLCGVGPVELGEADVIKTILTMCCLLLTSWQQDQVDGNRPFSPQSSAQPQPGWSPDRPHAEESANQLGYFNAEKRKPNYKPAQYQSNLDRSPIASVIETPSVLDESNEIELPKYKKQALQKLSISGGWLGATNNNDLSSTFASTGITFGVPLGSMDNILAVTPSFRFDWIDASSAIEVPSQLYDLSLDFFHTRKVNDRWKLLGMVRPSLRSDFRTSVNAVRVFGLGIFIWDYIPQKLAISMGAVYLGRADLPALPVVGLTWTPSKENRFEFQFPRTRALHRLRKDGARSELWSYLTIGIGGNTWAVKRRSGASDEVSLRDIRLTAGIERIVAGGGGFFFETGLALDRSIEFLSDEASRVTLSNGVLFSAGWTY